MSEIKDDPRQVLALLNSLGFVGITAEQLRAFMKDLKMHRKIKERERQQWKDEMKRRILQKQREELTKLLILTSSSDSPREPDESVVGIKIHRVSDSEMNNEGKNYISKIMTRKMSTKISPEKGKDALVGTVVVDNRSRNQTEATSVVGTLRKVKPVTPPRPASAPDVSELVPRVSRPESTASEPTRRRKSPRNPSTCSSRSQSKSFIRPWKLNPDSHRTPKTTKSDPVTLYQNYQKGWKQISFPGENQHTEIRWAVREKMLGTDPTPRPMLKKSCSSMSGKRR